MGPERASQREDPWEAGQTGPRAEATCPANVSRLSSRCQPLRQLGGIGSAARGERAGRSGGSRGARRTKWHEAARGEILNRSCGPNRTAPPASGSNSTAPRELAAVERASLGVGGLLLPSAEPLPPDTLLALTLRVAGGAEVAVAARVVAALPGALALHLEGNPAEIVRALLAPPPAVAGRRRRDRVGERRRRRPPPASLWERLRRMTPPQRMLLAPKADRFERAILVQDSDPQVLFALLKNPRLGARRSAARRQVLVPLVSGGGAHPQDESLVRQPRRPRRPDPQPEAADAVRPAHPAHPARQRGARDRQGRRDQHGAEAGRAEAPPGRLVGARLCTHTRGGR